MITIKDKVAQSKMISAGRMLADIFVAIEPHIIEGITTLELDTLITELMQSRGMITQCKGYMGYKHVSCISVNEEVVHGIPLAHKSLKKGDLVKVDVCAALDGYCADMARCFFVGGASMVPQRLIQLVEVAYAALDKGIACALVGNRLSDISAAIQQEVEKYDFGVVRAFAGHGIGRRMHEEPEVLNYGKPGRGPVLKAGMALALEPMITAGRYDVRVLADGWTAVTVDGSFAAHVEDTIIITENGPHITTRLA